MNLAGYETPFAVVDLAKARRNVERLSERLSRFEVSQRPHVKTAKSLPAAELMHRGDIGPITVSTLAEAEEFAQAGYTDITYAVGIAPHKLTRVAELLNHGVELKILLDHPEQVAAVVECARSRGQQIPALIEIDVDGHRGGIRPESPKLVSLGRQLAEAGCLAGVLSHAGESYFAATTEQKQWAAENERALTVQAADRLREAGYEVGTVSVGSTPTAHFARDLSGVTEVRAGNYIFFDLVMAGIGVCGIEDIALSVAVTVIGHRPEKGWLLTDGGWMATSRDRGTAAQPVDQGYGLVTDIYGRLLEGVVMTGASQEHGILTARDGHDLPEVPIGTRLRILPNHACATAGQYSSYQVIESAQQELESGPPRVIDTWTRIQGW